jgi:peptidoglycan/LPS O-acetylase OafA/YrhL
VSATIATSEDGPSQLTSGAPSFILTAGSKFRHFSELDGLRGSAVLLVALGHTLASKLQLGFRWTQISALGVLIFFVLSGFLITGLLCSEERRFERISLRDFYLRRVFRILPALTVFLLVVSLLISLGLVTDTSWRTVAVSVVFLKNIYGSGATLAHLWSLSLEEQFYLVWPLLFRLLGRRRLLAPTLGLIGGTMLYRLTAIRLAPLDYGRGIFELRSDFRMDSILVGCALAIWLDRRPGWLGGFSSLTRWATHPAWVVPFLTFWTLDGDVQPLWSVYLTVQTALVACLVFHVVAFPDSVIGRVLRLRWLRFVGLISYSLYLWQQLFLTNVPRWGFVQQFPFCLFFAGAAAVVSYFAVERPFLEWKRRFSPAS